MQRTPYDGRVRGHQHLAGRLGRAVRSERRKRRALADRGRVHRSRHRIRRGEHERGHAGHPRRLEHAVRALDVGLEGELGLLDRAQHGGHGRKMHDRVDAAGERRSITPALRCRPGRSRPRDRDAAAGRRRARAPPARERRDELPTDETRPAGDEDPAGAGHVRVAVAHVLARAPAVFGSSLRVARQLTVGMMALRSTRSLCASTMSNRWSIRAMLSSVGVNPSSSRRECLTL